MTPKLSSTKSRASGELVANSSLRQLLARQTITRLEGSKSASQTVLEWLKVGPWADKRLDRGLLRALWLLQPHRSPPWLNPQQSLSKKSKLFSSRMMIWVKRERLLKLTIFLKVTTTRQMWLLPRRAAISQLETQLPSLVAAMEVPKMR